MTKYQQYFDVNNSFGLVAVVYFDRILVFIRLFRVTDIVGERPSVNPIKLEFFEIQDVAPEAQITEALM